MRQPALLWRTYQQASKWHCRPSDLLDIEDRHRAYKFDQAIWLFGTSLEHELESVEGKNKQERKSKTSRIIQKWIPEQASGKKSKSKQYRDPAARGMV